MLINEIHLSIEDNVLKHKHFRTNQGNVCNKKYASCNVMIEVSINFNFYTLHEAFFIVIIVFITLTQLIFIYNNFSISLAIWSGFF